MFDMIRLAKRPFAVLAAVLVAALVPACTKNAATGRSQFLILSGSEEIALGTQAMPELVKEFGGPVPSASLNAYVTNIGANLSKATETDSPNLPWQFTFLNSNVINAFALPGGKVFITRGLAAKMTNEAQMAHVLGHEIGHVTAKHTAERMSQQLIAEFGVAILGAATKKEEISQVASQAAQLVLLGYSRDQELEADALGMRYIARMGYNPAAAIEVMQILKEAGGGNDAPEILLTHPYPENRIAQINKLLQTEFRSTQNNPKYDVYKQRFQANFRSKLALLPPAPDDDGRTRFAFGDSSTWCAHCAAAAAAERAATHAVP